VQAYGKWPFSGEIDILEGTGYQEEFVSGIHFGGPWEHRANLATRSNCPAASAPGGLDTFGPCRGSFHTWALDWGVRYEGGKPVATLVWSVDGVEINRLRSEQWWSNVPGSGGQQRIPKPMAPFDQPFHLILNLAVGGSNFAGFPPPGASFDTGTEREERVTLCLSRTDGLLLIKIKLCYTD
jgi:beta-glucanase (GH16 family)